MNGPVHREATESAAQAAASPKEAKENLSPVCRILPSTVSPHLWLRGTTLSEKSEQLPTFLQLST